MVNTRLFKNVANTLVVFSIMLLGMSAPLTAVTARGTSASLQTLDLWQQQADGEGELIVQQPSLSADGLVLRNAVPLQVISSEPAQIPENSAVSPNAGSPYSEPLRAGSAFLITFVPAGGRDYWGNTCLNYPKAARDSFYTAASILSQSFKFTVPVTLRACWITGPDIKTFGYWGGVSVLRDFTGALRSNTWFPSSLANNLHGSDLLPGEYDFHVSFNSEIAWTMGSSNSSTMMLISFHQLVHALGFFCSADYSADGLGSYGYGTGFPSIYDIYLENSEGVSITDYDNPSLALGELFTGGKLFFGGLNATYYNGVEGHARMDANNYWADNRNGSHFEPQYVRDYADTIMLYDGVHKIYSNLPGPVTRGILYDLGWRFADPSLVPLPIAPNGSVTTPAPVFQWTLINKATQYQVRVYKGSSTTAFFTQTITAPVCKTYTCQVTSSKTLTAQAYKWQVRAYVRRAWQPWSTKMSFSVASAGSAGAPSFEQLAQP